MPPLDSIGLSWAGGDEKLNAIEVAIRIDRCSQSVVDILCYLIQAFSELHGVARHVAVRASYEMFLVN